VVQQPQITDEALLLHAWGDVLRRYRKWQGLSRKELARRAGISSVFLGEIERGEKDASSHSMCRLAEALGVPLGELYMRVAAQLDRDVQPDKAGQTALPMGMRETPGEYLDAVSAANDETAFDLYKRVRLLPSDQQVLLLALANTMR